MASLANSSFGQTLQFITEIKLQELEKQRVAYQVHAQVLDEVKSFDIIKKVEVLAKAVKSWTGSGSFDKQTTDIGGTLRLSNLEFWLQQAKNDPSFSPEIAEGWAGTLEEHIRHSLTRFDAARLFGNLFNEWLASGDSVALPYQPGTESADIDDVSKSSDEASYVEIGRKEMHEQKEQLVSIIFKDRPIDVRTLKTYLADLFASEEATKALETLRKEIKRFSYSFQRRKISKKDVENTIKGILATGLMDEEKRTTLKTFEENSSVLDEIASVLNMRLANLESWSWPSDGVSVEFRRHLNGKYRAFADPDIVDALLLHYIGVEWQVALKDALRRVFDSKAWIRPIPPTHKVKEYRQAQLRGDNGDSSIDAERKATQRQHFFLSQLQDKPSIIRPYDDLLDAPETDKNVIGPAAIKQKLLNMMTTECYLNTTLHGTYAALCSDVEWFGPSLPHASILTILEFFGMSKTWLTFFKAFLEAPMRFKGETESRVRKCGTPISYSISVVCGEAIMFIMDLAVNQRANGLYLYRLHDDLWLWDADVSKVADGWAEMKKYAEIVGIKFNDKKTGSAYVGPGMQVSSTLPVGDIRWGFLKFDVQASRFRLDQSDIDFHIIEMRRQLASTKSVFGWVNAYNKYMAFFLRCMGGAPANCFGHAHVTELVDTFARIQRELFPSVDGSASGGAVGYLKKRLEERFGIADLPEGYFYFPISNGGLELRNTMLEFLALERRDKPLVAQSDAGDEAPKIEHSPDSGPDTDSEEDTSSDSDTDSDSEPDDSGADASVFAENEATAEHKFPARIKHDRQLYVRLKEVWEQDEDKRRARNAHLASAVSDDFMSFEEYISLRESWLSSWGSSYRDMLKFPEARNIVLAPRVRDLVSKDYQKFSNLDWYLRWVLSMYGEGVIKRFGNLDVVDPDLIPVGMVQLFRSSRMKLDQ